VTETVKNFSHVSRFDVFMAVKIQVEVFIMKMEAA